jgi:eukaryotic-like serine/threonine-protein kinase
VGTVLAERFELLSQAARGGMGSVHRARDRLTGATVAVKVLSLDRPFDLARFEREASVLAHLHHPRVPAYVAHGATSQGIRYLVQEWVDGITLATHLTTIGVTVDDAVTIAVGVAEALGAAHEHGVVHRDVKPPNIILDGGEPSRIKLVDFGIARMAADAGVLTRTGVLIGTPSYMSPEQARGSILIEPAADIWSLGCVLYEMVTGRKAFAGRTPESVRAKVVLAAHEPIASYCPEGPPELARLVDEMLSKSPYQRPPTGQDAAAALARVPRTTSEVRRRLGIADKPTVVLPGCRTPGEVANSYVFVMPVPPADSETPPPSKAKLQEIAAQHDLEIHELDDGAALLEARALGAEGAIAATRAAVELREAIGDSALSVFARVSTERLADAIDRGSDALEVAAMGELFAEVMDAVGTIRVDEHVAELIVEEFSIDRTDAGAVVVAPPKRSHTA